MQGNGGGGLTDAEILVRVRDLFRYEFDDNRMEVDPSTSPGTLSLWDSLAHVRLVSAIEAEFDIQFDLAEIEGISSVADFVLAVRNHAGA